MAYSTVSQLGYMFAALGCGQGDLASLAVTAAIFHLFTHAFFKALLFLASGSVMHAMGHVIDMREFSGLRKVMPITHWTFLCGAAALAGVPLLSGFWSKDEVFAVAKEVRHSGVYHTLYEIIFLSLIVTALLTAYYTFRAYFRTFWGPLKVPASAGSHGHHDDDHHDDHGHTHQGEAHESPAIMTVPLIVLAIGAVAVGGLLWMNHNFAHFLGRSIDFIKYLPQVEHHPDIALMVGSGVVALLGIGLAYWMHVRSPELAQTLATRFPRLHRWSQNRFYFDELYGWIAVGPLTVLAVISKVFDMLVDGIVDLVGRFPKNVGSLLRPIQNGLVQFYALAMMLGLAVLLFFMTRQ